MVFGSTRKAVSFGITVFLISLLALFLFAISYIPKHIFWRKPVLQDEPLAPETENTNFRDAFIVKDQGGLYKIDALGRFTKFYDTNVYPAFELQADRFHQKLFFVLDQEGAVQHEIFSCDVTKSPCIPQRVVNITAAALLHDPQFDFSQHEKDLLSFETLGLANIHLSPNDSYLSFDVSGNIDTSTITGPRSVDTCLNNYPLIYSLADNTIKPVIRNPPCDDSAPIGGESWLNDTTLLMQDGATDETDYAQHIAQIPVSLESFRQHPIIGYTKSRILSIVPLAMQSTSVLVTITTTDSPSYTLLPIQALNNSTNENVYLLQSYPTFSWTDDLQGIFMVQNRPIVVHCGTGNNCRLSRFDLSMNKLVPFEQTSNDTKQTVNLGDITYTIDRLHFPDGTMLVHIVDNQPSFLGNQDYVNHYFLVDANHTIFQNILTAATFLSREPAYY